MKGTRTWWLAYAGCAAFVIAAMAGISVLVLRMEHVGFTMRAEADRNAEMRAALWDMESWLIAHLGRESSRPYDEYQSYFPADNVYTRYLSKITPGDVYAPSPLLTFDSEYFPIHFQIDPSNTFTSPQVPAGNELDLAQATLLPEGWIDRKNDQLALVNRMITYDDAALFCSDATGAPAAQSVQTAQAFEAQQGVSSEWQQQVDESESPLVQQARDQQEFARRAQARNRADQVLDKESYANVAPDAFRNAREKGGDAVEIAPFVPIWIERDAASPDDLALELVFVREVAVGKEAIYQGFLCNWPRMRAELIAQIRDRFPEADIVPVIDGPDAPGPAQEAGDANAMFRLASIPAVIDCEIHAAVSPGFITPARATLGIAWLFVLIAVGAAGLTLRSTIDFARRRSRFASAVTHELRTPLTTFQMYSEMLADGMVRDPEQQKVYHETLHEESTRLNAIVENVLAYARIEEGRDPPRNVERTRIGDLFARFEPGWSRRAAKCEAHLEIDLDDLHAREITVDVESLDQILTNLIDNACKYGCSDGGDGFPTRRVSRSDQGNSIEVNARIDAGRLRIEVRDHGPGIDPVAERAIYQPFDRGPIEPGSATPGVGLGLALSRELAARMGGSLTHARPADGEGACFVLQLPLIG